LFSSSNARPRARSAAWLVASRKCLFSEFLTMCAPSIRSSSSLVRSAEALSTMTVSTGRSAVSMIDRRHR
jgi:hypothetical protein